ncbi:hypothetical protein PVK06_031451 [Gossypium arboreum]|uniref:[phosphatase 2A protein]-leucine-carboxy methyltransferase n=1 Tax=Gossypium arboreum TaxID=29729 RepID=A0ABR0NR29_GOSAR|nr:hypothetical protein PVK06_031451 [Gossypium arboreum]
MFMVLGVRLIGFKATSDPPKICTAEDQKKKDDEDLSAEDLALKQQLELYVERVQDSDPGLQKVGLESMSMNLAGEIAQEYGKRQLCQSKEKFHPILQLFDLSPYLPSVSTCSRSCVKKGYMKDDYIHLFVRRPVRRSPVINHGYFARWAAFGKLLYQFLDCEGSNIEKGKTKRQILSLGAGFDTTNFQLQDEGKASYLYVELDFKEVTSKKASLIESYSQLRDKIGATASILRENGEVLSEHYKLLSVDLHDIHIFAEFISVALQAMG